MVMHWRCIGDAVFDCIASDVYSVWIQYGFSVESVIETNRWNAFPGGATANVATTNVATANVTTASKLGTWSVYVGCLGADKEDDKESDDIMALLENGRCGYFHWCNGPCQHVK